MGCAPCNSHYVIGCHYIKRHVVVYDMMSTFCTHLFSILACLLTKPCLWFLWMSRNPTLYISLAIKPFTSDLLLKGLLLNVLYTCCVSTRIHTIWGVLPVIAPMLLVAIAHQLRCDVYSVMMIIIARQHSHWPHTHIVWWYFGHIFYTGLPAYETNMISSWFLWMSRNPHYKFPYCLC